MITHRKARKFPVALLTELGKLVKDTYNTNWVWNKIYFFLSSKISLQLVCMKYWKIIQP